MPATPTTTWLEFPLLSPGQAGFASLCQRVLSALFRALAVSFVDVCEHLTVSHTTMRPMPPLNGVCETVITRKRRTACSR